MATATTSQDVRDSFEDKVTQIRIMIESEFSDISKLLITRKNKLFQELEEILNKYKQENIKRKEEISELREGLKLIQEKFTYTSLKEYQSEFVISLQKKQKTIESESKPKNSISIEFDNKLLDLMNVFGKISVDNSNDSYLPVVQYTGKVRPVVSVGTRGNGRGEFYNPWGVVVEHKSDNIYVADQSNHRVQVFD